MGQVREQIEQTRLQDRKQARRDNKLAKRRSSASGTLA